MLKDADHWVLHFLQTEGPHEAEDLRKKVNAEVRSTALLYQFFVRSALRALFDPALSENRFVAHMEVMERLSLIDHWNILSEIEGEEFVSSWYKIRKEGRRELAQNSVPSLLPASWGTV